MEILAGTALARSTSMAADGSAWARSACDTTVCTPASPT
jgi:hypothetical protein